MINNAVLLDIQSAMLALAIITPRVLVCLVILPGFGMQVLTGMAKNTAAMAIAIPAIVPTFYFVQATPPDFLMCGMLIFKEALLGMMLGIMMSIPIWVVQSVGSIFDSQRSPIQIQANNAGVDKDASAVGAMLIQAVVLIMIQAGLFLALARILIESYGTWPAYMLTPPFELGHLDVLVKRFGDLFFYIMVYGAPVIMPLILIEFGFAIIGVFASNLQVSFASAPIKSITGMLILLLYW
ncbi:MAG: EscT/YscT/HrcT family type III secretion system export apparatus protein, partial [Janthinobacterium lividum]